MSSGTSVAAPALRFGLDLGFSADAGGSETEVDVDVDDVADDSDDDVAVDMAVDDGTGAEPAGLAELEGRQSNSDNVPSTAPG